MDSEFHLPPGFRFHPSDAELIEYYLLKKVNSCQLPADVIVETDLYNFDPWDLPEMSKFGENEWYFFSPRYKKYPNGTRPNRKAASGFWKATGPDKPILTSSGSRILGVKKALTFYIGKPPLGMKTEWVMNEYRLPHPLTRPSRLRMSMQLDNWVLCRVRTKGNMSKTLQKSQVVPRGGSRIGRQQAEKLLCKDENDVIKDTLYKEYPLVARILSGQDLPPLKERNSC